MNLLLITENEKKHYVLIKEFNKFMYNQTKHKERKHFCMYCLQCFSSESEQAITSPRMLLSWATCTYRAQFFNARNNYCIDKDFGIPTALVNKSVTVNQNI